jgi:GT2 family glycosyltransferase
MNVAQLFRKLRVISNVEIVVPFLLEVIRVADQTSRYSLLQRLQRIGQRVFFRFAEHGWPIQARFWLEWGSSISGHILWRLAEQQVNMLGHDYGPVNLKSEAAPHRSKADSKIRRLASVVNNRRRW